jgi:hypothetical protein
MEVTDEGIIRLVNPEQLAKATSLMEVTDEEIERLVKPEQ